MGLSDRSRRADSKYIYEVVWKWTKVATGTEKVLKMTKIRFYCPRSTNFFLTILPKGHNTELLDSVFGADSEYIYEDV